MSDVKRYFVGSVSDQGFAEIDYEDEADGIRQLQPDCDMEFVLASDYDALAAECVEWRRVSERDLATAVRLGIELDDMKADRDRLAAELQTVTRGVEDATRQCQSAISAQRSALSPGGKEGAND